MAEAKEAVDNTREEFILQRVAKMFNLRQSLDKFRKSFEGDDNIRVIKQFLADSDDLSYAFFMLSGGEGVTVTATAPPPSAIKRKIVLMVKTVREQPIEKHLIKEQVTFMELYKNVLEIMFLVCQEAYLPILSNPQNQQGWSDLVSKDLIENKFHQFLSNVYVTIGEVKGRTMLPVPPETSASDRISSKDKAHVLEGAVITWTKQIKNVLKQDPESALKQGTDPDPLVELKFWKNKAENLNSIHRQLQTEKIKKVLKFLEQNKSTYTGQFSKLQKEVQAARQEANDNSKFLKTLEPLLGELTDEAKEFTEMEPLFVPIMHTIKLIWDNSQFYNTPARLVVLIREICNAVISQACRYLSGKEIFTMIQNEETGIACDKLGTILDVCTKFKDSYFNYKNQAKNTWKITTNALFVRLDAFMERCQDIQHLTTTIVQFSKLSKIEIGGTKGKTLTSSVKQIYAEFQQAVEEFQGVGYDIMDVAAKKFDDDFYNFRSRIKELERRLGSVLTQGFDDCDTLYGRFKLLDSFEGLLNRPIIQDELEKKHIILLESYKQDLKTVQQIFLEFRPLVDRLEERAPISKNMPPVTGAVNWARGLMERIKEPMEKLSSLSQAVTDREEYKDVQKLYSSLIKSLTEYQNSKVKDWEAEVESSSKDKLKQPLLVRKEKNLLKVNFDPALVRLLREVKYFSIIDMVVPQSASEIFSKNDVYRTQTGNLEIIVTMYNQIKQTLLPEEEPLLDDRIKKMDQTLEPGLKDLKWRSANIVEFIHTSMTVVKDVSMTVETMQKNLKRIHEIMQKWADKPLIERKLKPMSADDFDQQQKAAINQRHGDIISGGKEINRLIKETGECVKNAKRTTHWNNYVDFVNEIVIEGIAKTVITTLKHMADMFDPAIIKKTDAQPLFEIKMELSNADLIFRPEIEENVRGSGLKDLISSWIADFMKVGALFPRIDGSNGDYLCELRDHMFVQAGLSVISANLDWIESETKRFKANFLEYSYLWTQDLAQTFQEFLKQGEQEKKEVKEGEEPMADDRLEELKDNPIFEGIPIRIPGLNLFNEKITQLKTIQSKIASVATPHDIGWLRIHVEPLKVALNKRVTEWIHTFTSFLLNNVTGRLNNVMKFSGVVGQGIELANPDEISNEALMKVMTHIRDVRTITDICDGMFAPLREQVTLLKKHGVVMDAELMTKIENMKTKWEDLKLKVNNVKAIILPHQTEETKRIKVQLSQFDEKVSHFREDFQAKSPFSFEDLSDEIINNAYKTIDSELVALQVIELEARNYNNLNTLFELEKSAYKPLKDCRSELINLKVLWDAISFVQNTYSDWKTTLWDKIDTEYLMEQNKNLEKMVKELPKELRGWRGYSALQDKVRSMTTMLPLINELHSPAMEARHWGHIMNITGKKINHSAPTFCLEDLLQLKLHKYEEDVREIVSQAEGEAKIEKKLNDIETAWSTCNFEFEVHKDCPILKALDETIEMLETHSMSLLEMQAKGKTVEYFRARVEEWLNKFRTVESVISIWIKVQKNWQTLESIFLASDDIRSQLPDDTKRFEGVDGEFRQIMQDARDNPLVIQATTQVGRFDLLKDLNDSIELCEKALNDYLESKKKAFPRFYFVSNQALLDILSNSNNPLKVCEYLGDCFDSLKWLEFEKEGTIVRPIGTAMFAKDGERVNFPHEVRGGRFICEGAVENWLSSLEAMMREVLKNILERARVSAEMWDIQGEKTREQWIEDYPAQISLVGTQIVWTEEVIRALEEMEGGSETAMKDYVKVCQSRIDKLIDRVIQPTITKEMRNKIITIITNDVHARDVVEKFQVNKVSDTGAFAWQSQLKFYWKEDFGDPKINCRIYICDWKSTYAYEYVGNCGRLVITPLTDRCYITLTQALNLIMGGAPAGPAGTGKTETTKDLGRAVGLPVMVFNCSEQMNYKSMAQIFMGLAQTGAWGCFDEFNRISIEVLSVVSSQVKQILDALKRKQARFVFQEEDISLLKTVGFFITMNPGYAGRTELPENLKALFRSCAMVTPDTMLICENMLMSEGFKAARALSNKFVTLYDLSRELLSKQRHYDWGLRAVKSVLRMAGKLRRADLDIDEDRVLQRALRDFNLPKIVTDDKLIFLRLISDLFPGADPPSKFNQQLYQRVKESTKAAKLQAEELFVIKCIQLSEILEVRHSVFIVGPPGCGKTEVWKMLAAVDGTETVYETLNPKAVTSNELFGYMTKTKEWKDGLLSVIMRNMYKNVGKYKASLKNKWVVLDGDIDPEWIESLNTVMDDNKVLTLVSNERIPLTDAMRMLFEVSHLKNATPATVSRAGVLFINDSDIGIKPYVDSWLETIEDDIARSTFMLAYQQKFEANVDEIHRLKKIVPVVDLAIAKTMCHILQALIAGKEFKDWSKQAREDDKKTVFDCFFIYSGIWGIGAGLDDDMTQKAFSNWWKGVAKKFPEADTVFDYFYDYAKLAWVPWAEKVTAYQPIGEQLFQNIIVPTADIVRLKSIMDLHVKTKKPVMFVGSSGTCKTTLVKDFLTGLNSEEVLFHSINFNSYTDSEALQRFMESHVKKRLGQEYGPPASKQMIFFIDDINMPAVEKYGTQSSISLITQLLNYHQVYDRDHLEEQKLLKDIQFMACMNHKAGSYTIDQRAQRHFTTFSCLRPSKEVLGQIYSSILASHLNQFDQGISKIGEKMITATVMLFIKITDDPEFSPSARKFHYQFNIRDISRIVEGVMQSIPNLYKGQPAKFIKLWVHECDRTYLDRLITESDVEKYKGYLQTCAKPLEDDAGEDIYAPPNIFTSFVSAHGGNDKAYLPIKEMPQLKKVLEDKLNEYNETNAVMNLVLFDMAMEHICRITRILDRPAGNALLVGVGGSGKQSLSRLASYILTYDVTQILVSESYGVENLKEDLKNIYQKVVKAGANPMSFMLTDTQIKEERFLIYINDLLSSGYVQDLFTDEDLGNILNLVKNEAKAAGYLDTTEQLFEFFLNKARQNLHMILCFSPVSEAFRIRSRKFPALISCTLVDWFHGWPRDALVDVGYRFLQDLEMPTDELRQSIGTYIADVHVSIETANKEFLARERRFNYTTPKSFLELIDFYKKLLMKKRKVLDDNIDRLETGLTILQKTKDKVEGLKNDLNVKKVEVEIKQKETNDLIDKVTASSAVAAKEKEAADKEEAIASELTAQANTLKAEADKELEAALPAMERAKEAVDCLTKASIQELKTFGSPAAQVVEVTKAVLMMKGEKKNYAWQNAQKMMGNPAKFIEDLKGFRKEEIDQWILDGVYPIIREPYFNKKEMAGKSVAASFLCEWVVNVVEYNRIYKNVKPLMEKLDGAKEEVAKKDAELSIIRAKVKEVTDKVDALNKELDAANERKAKVEAEAEMCQTKLDLANRLVGGLADENKRWGENVLAFREEGKTVIGDSLVAAAFVSYIGPFSAVLRLKLWSEIWIPELKVKEIPYTEGVDPLRVLATDSDEATWKNEGLPADRMSIENASIITSCARWPLIIDPQLQGSKWIRGRVGDNLEVIQFSMDRWNKRLENAIQMGKVLMIENIGIDLDASLEPLLARAVIKKGRILLIKFGSEEIEYSPDFRLFLQTKLSNPHYRPEIAAQCTIINFIVTESGLEDQLLAMVVNVEKPELESTKKQLVRQQNDNKVRLAQLEDDLLTQLSKADPDTILSNIALIETLELSKKQAKEIMEMTRQSQETEIAINRSREVYRRVAAEGSTLYFLIISLCIVDHMYQYSLEAFTVFFFKAIEKTTKYDEEETRVLSLRESIRMTIYQWVSRGLFEKHKQIFMSLITLRLMQKKVIPVDYDVKMVNFLLKCPLKTDVEKPQALDWLPDSSWYAVMRLIEIEEFQTFGQNMEKDAPTRFRDWFNDLAPEEAKLPLDWKRLDAIPFQKMLVLRCLRPDRLTIYVNDFIKMSLPNGNAFTDMDQGLSFTDILVNVLEDATSSTPIFFILSPGTDPVTDVERIGKKRNIEEGKNYWNVAMGQGTEGTAMSKLELGHKEGHWVMLQNIHLMPKWLGQLEKKLDGFAVEGSNLNFRLFLSAEPSPDIPIGILERSIKLTNEPPTGMKANLKRAFAFFTKEEFDERDNRVKSILFGLCFFHALVLERRKFGAKGWNMRYPFSVGDLRDSALVLNSYMENAQGTSKIPWDDLRYIFGEIMYGGHIVDDWDRKLCKTYLETLMKNDLLDETEMFPFAEGKSTGFRSPAPISFEKYLEHIDDYPTETPLAFGMHPNAEIGFRTQQSQFLFSTLLDLQPKDDTGSADDTNVRTKNEIAADIVREILEDKNIENLIFDLHEIKEKVPDGDDKLCYINVFLQECEYMNVLLKEMVRSLGEITLALKGELTVSEQMEKTIDALVLERVPTTWGDLAYPSMRGLASWLSNLVARIAQLSGWKDEPTVIPKIVNIARLFNPQSFLTAIKQYTAQRQSLELNKLYIVTDITKKTEAEIEGPAREGSFVAGMNLEGARWDVANNMVEESKAREMFCPLPIVNCKASLMTGVESKEDKNLYQCPCYKTEDRGRTYVFTAQLRSPKYPPAKWVLAGAAIILDVEGIGEATKAASSS